MYGTGTPNSLLVIRKPEPEPFKKGGTAITLNVTQFWLYGKVFLTLLAIFRRFPVFVFERPGFLTFKKPGVHVQRGPAALKEHLASSPLQAADN